jgi:hypothetical protein
MTDGADMQPMMMCSNATKYDLSFTKFSRLSGSFWMSVEKFLFRPVR